MNEIRLTCTIDLARDIVWEALVDPDLVEGWLHPSERLVTGTSPVEFREPDDPDAVAVLEVISPALGQVRIELVRRAEGVSSESTGLELVVRDSWGRTAERAELWQIRLDQLDDLLRGHPVDWATWAAEHHAEGMAAASEEALRRLR